MSRFFLTSALVLFSLAVGLGQDAARLASEPDIKAALDAVKRNEPHFIDEQIRICEIPAPPFHEEARGQELERLFKQLGLHDVRIDKAGNVIGVRPGASAHPNLLFQAHLDTVFPPKAPTSKSRARATC